MNGLQDVDDDVRSIAAGALLPVADTLSSCMPGQVIMCTRAKIIYPAVVGSAVPVPPALALAI